MNSSYTVLYRYNAVNFLINIHKRHPIAHALGPAMGCLLWIQHLIDTLPQFLQLFMQYLTIQDRVITALNCICLIRFGDIVVFAENIFQFPISWEELVRIWRFNREISMCSFLHRGLCVVNNDEESLKMYSLLTIIRLVAGSYSKLT